MGQELDDIVGEALDDFAAGLTSAVPARSHSAGEQGDCFGRYTLTERIGEGGFGSVWRAEQREPVQREVALKILKMGMDTREVLARFEQERQALALMDHPGIAQVLDAGATPTGRPFFVMELVKGLPITQFCDERDLPMKERLALFCDVCRAVQHAHQKGVIHRDLKPSNILVSPRADESPLVKVIDFGIAKATGENRLGDASMLTQANQIIGTPVYMSPEQLSGSADVDTRSDVYSLGVLLYELLTGTPPFTREELASQSHDEIVRMIRERVPPRPSTRTMQNTPTQHTREGMAPSLLLRGDLDCIAMKALEKEPDRRYESASAFASDIQRFLNQEPILARPASTAYVLRQFTRRHRVAVAGGIAVFLALLIGLTVSSILFLREKESRRLAHLEAEKSRQISLVLTEALEGAGPSSALGHDTTMMRSILDRTADRIGADADIHPEVETAIRSVMGSTYGDIHDYPQAIEQYERVAELQKELHPGDHEDVAKAILDLADAVEAQGDLKRAESHVLEAIDMYERLEGDHANEILFAKILVAWIYMKSDRSAEGEPLAEEGYEAWLKNPAEEWLSEAAKTYGIILSNLGKRDEAEFVYRNELETWRRIFGSDHPQIANCLDNLGMILVTNGKFDEAEGVLHEALEQGRRMHGDRSPHEDHVLSRLATIAAKRGEWEKELNLLRDGVAVSRRAYTEGHRYRKEILNHLITALFRQAEENAGGKAAERIAEMEQLAVSQKEVKVDAEKLEALKASVR